MRNAIGILAVISLIDMASVMPVAAATSDERDGAFTLVIDSTSLSMTRMVRLMRNCI